jgi:hypothetical protein
MRENANLRRQAGALLTDCEWGLPVRPADQDRSTYSSKHQERHRYRHLRVCFKDADQFGYAVHSMDDVH